jgi:hypothetical protein
MCYNGRQFAVTIDSLESSDEHSQQRGRTVRVAVHHFPTSAIARKPCPPARLLGHLLEGPEHGGIRETHFLAGRGVPSRAQIYSLNEPIGQTDFASTTPLVLGVAGAPPDFILERNE